MSDEGQPKTAPVGVPHDLVYEGYDDAGSPITARLQSFLDAVRDMPEVRSVQVVGHEDDGEETAS